jgi:hypothetical protein
MLHYDDDCDNGWMFERVIFLPRVSEGWYRRYILSSIFDVWKCTYHFASFFLRAVKRYVLIHLPGYGDKLEYILFMLRKLYAFAAGDCGVDNADSLQNQELLLPGHLMCTFVKEKFEETLDNIRIGLMKEMRVDYAKFLGNVSQARWWTRVVDRYGMLSSGGVGKKVQHFLSTGNIISTTGLDLMQVSGYTIVAEKLNFLRFCAHFRSVHRGQFFCELLSPSECRVMEVQHVVSDFLALCLDSRAFYSYKIFLFAALSPCSDANTLSSRGYYQFIRLS